MLKCFLLTFLLAGALFFFPATVTAGDGTGSLSPDGGIAGGEGDRHDLDEPFSGDLYQDDPLDESPTHREHYYRARVVKINETRVDEHEYYTVVEQEIVTRISGGDYDGKEIEIVNTFFEGDPVYDFILEEGQEVIVVALGEKGDFSQVYVQDMARDRGLYYLLAVFVVALLLVGRMKGLKTLVTIVFTLFLVFQFLLPFLLLGYSPIPLAVATAALAISFTLLVIGGFNLKSVVAILGTTCGVIVAGLMAYWAGSLAQLTGFGSHEAQMLYFMDRGIDMRGLLFAGIIIGSLGAITDIGMSVASAAAEIRRANPDLPGSELFRGALNVGRDVMGTMANTLIMAYVGAAAPMLLLVMGYDMDWLKIINMDIIATEFVRGVAGSIGLVAAVPVTAFLARYLPAQSRPVKKV